MKPYKNYGELAPSDFGELQPYYNFLRYLMENPLGGDARVAAFAKGALNLVHSEPRFREAISDALVWRQQTGQPAAPQYMANLTLRSAQHLLRRRPDYGDLSSTPGSWARAIRELLDRDWSREDIDSAVIPEEYDVLPLGVLLKTKEVRTVVDARYKAAQLYIAIHRDKFPGQICYLDMGTSAGIGAKALMADQLKHSVNALLPVPHRNPVPHSDNFNATSLSLESTPALTKYIQEKLSTPINFKAGVGVDIITPGDPAEEEWIKSCYYPSEITENKDKMISKFDHLRQMSLSNWQTLGNIDCSDEAAADAIADQSGIGQFDLITIFTVLDQMQEWERVQTISNAKKLLAPGGTVLVSSFARASQSKPSGLEFYDIWHPYTYRTMQIDSSAAGNQWEDVFWWNSGRCTEVLIAPTATFGLEQNPIDGYYS